MGKKVTDVDSAMDHLSSVVTDGEVEDKDEALRVAEESYRVIAQYLKRLVEDPAINWEDQRTREGVAAMMSLVGQSAEWLDRVVGGRVEERKEYQALQEFYAKKIASRLENEWQEDEEAPLHDVNKMGLKDFETVKADSEYELFYIRNEEGKSYFDADLLRSLRLSCDFGGSGAGGFEEDPLLKVRSMQDRDLQASAAQIIHECHDIIADFCKVVHEMEENELARSLNMALVALHLSANAHNLLQNVVGKSSISYFHDFHRFLRRAMKTTEYQKLVAYSQDGKEERMLLDVTHRLCHALFMRTGGVREETIGLLHRTMRRGEEEQQKKGKHLVKGESVWNQFLIDDEKFRTLLAKFPNGPLFKILDLVREEHEEDEVFAPFDPIGQDNLPSKLYRVGEVDVLRIPSPTKQVFINKADVVDDFKGFLRGAKKEHKHLLINLQDRTSWKEYARAHTLELLQMQAEFSHQLVVVTLPKSSDFYYQNNEYINQNLASEFIAALLARLEDPELCGYFFPRQMKKEELLDFARKTATGIHELFFDGKTNLSRKNREDFLEIFDQFLILQCMEWFKPSTMSFTCKDAIDTGAAAAATFYGFLQLLQGDFTEREPRDFLRWLLYTPALFIRERAIQSSCFMRAISALDRIDSSLAARGKEICALIPEKSRRDFRCKV